MCEIMSSYCRHFVRTKTILFTPTFYDNKHEQKVKQFIKSPSVCLSFWTNNYRQSSLESSNLTKKEKIPLLNNNSLQHTKIKVSIEIPISFILFSILSFVVKKKYLQGNDRLRYTVYMYMSARRYGDPVNMLRGKCRME